MFLLPATQLPEIDTTLTTKQSTVLISVFIIQYKVYIVKYARWASYVNVDYGFAFRYPTTSTLEQVPAIEERDTVTLMGQEVSNKALVFDGKDKMMMTGG
jgi:hypothetical protein